MEKKTFDRQGPEISEYGPEPSLREILEYYYYNNGLSRKESEGTADDYIDAFIGLKPCGCTAEMACWKCMD